MEEKVMKKLEDKKFCKKILGLESEEEVVKAFAEENIDISKEDVEKLGDIVENMISKMSKMSESGLDKVSGGGFEDVVKDVVEIYTIPGQIAGEAIENATPHHGRGVLNSESIGNAVFLAVTALQTYGLYKGGQWVINKGKQWWQSRKKK